MAVPYSPQPASIARFLHQVQSVGVPAKVTQAYLKQLGLKSSNDRYAIPVLKAIDFLDANGVPTQRWRDYRDKSRAKLVLATAIRDGYKDLFDVYSDAYRKDNEAIHNFYSARTNLSENTLKLVVQTFKTLCSEADFDALPATAEQTASVPERRPERGRAETAPMPVVKGRAVPNINVTVQLQLPATNDAEVYDKLFAALRKHLLDD